METELRQQIIMFFKCKSATSCKHRLTQSEINGISDLAKDFGMEIDILTGKESFGKMQCEIQKLDKVK
ncbi:hypothetical protein D3C87_2082360 [compost metagenome]